MNPYTDPRSPEFAYARIRYWMNMPGAMPHAQAWFKIYLGRLK